ncbi:MAG TPA: TetR family transcriptional regulator [Tepidisphaeraceae bacterium]
MTRTKTIRDASHASASPSGLPTCVPVDTSSATRQRLLEAAEVLFYEEGFHAVGMDRLLAAVEISKQALVRDLALCAGADDPVAFARELAMIFEGAFASRYLRRADDVVPILRRMTSRLFDQQLPTSA